MIFKQVWVSICLLAFLAAPAFSYEALIQLVQEKKVIGNLQQDNQAVIPFQSYATEGFSLPTHFQKLKVGRYEQRADFPAHLNLTRKRYEIINDPERYLSVIRVKDELTGKEVRQISVGRRAKRLVANPSINRLYVLCGGYFGSIWEIDTVHDRVVRKLPVFDGQQAYHFWNPADIAILPVGHTLMVASGTLHAIDLRSGMVRQEIPLPAAIHHVDQLFPVSNHRLGLIAYNRAGQKTNLIYDNVTGSLQPIKRLGFPQLNPFAVSIQTPEPEEWAVNPLGFIASKNADFIQVLDLEKGSPTGIIPVDFVVDQILLSQDRKWLFAYHSAFGQLSVVDLSPNSTRRFSVVARFQDARFASPQSAPLLLGQNGEHIYLWDGDKRIIASVSLSETRVQVDKDTVAVTPPLYLRVDIPFHVGLIRPAEQVQVSTPSRKRFYLKAGQLYTEYYAQVGQKQSAPPTPVEAGVGLTAIALSPDERQLFVLDGASNQLKVLDVFSHRVEAEIAVGKNPRNLLVSPQGDRIFVLNADEGSVAIVHRATREVRPLPFNLGLAEPFIVKIYNQSERITQLIQVEIPRYQRNAAQMVG